MDIKRGKEITIKSIDEETGTFIGYLSTYGNTDRVGDVIEKGAFDETIENLNVVPMCYNHTRNDVVGKLELSSDDYGLKVKAYFNLEIDLAKEVFSNVKFGAINSMSVGMFVQDYEPIDKSKPFGGWTIKKAEVYEGSIVTVPANQLAVIESVKELTEEERYELKTLRNKELTRKVNEILKQAQSLLDKKPKKRRKK
jgi:uncharacterized protein